MRSRHPDPFGSVHVNDPVCESAKAAQNVAYKAEHDACEAAKGAQNVLYKGEHDACEAAKASQNAAYKADHDKCELEKGAQNVAYKAEHDACELAKATQNAAYKAEHDGCELAKAGKKAACEAQKALDQTTRMVPNVHSGDLIGPAAVNLFRRALNEDPASLTSALALPPANVGAGPLGDAELGVNAALRVAASTRDKDDTGDDLNLMVMMVMAKLRFPTLLTNTVITQYAQGRALSYGSYLGAYYAVYGEDPTDMKARMDAGIAGG